MKLGITGHQSLPNPEVWSWIESVMREELKTMAAPLTAISSLAAGADQLLARLVLEDGGTVRAIIPYEGIESSFMTAADLQGFRKIVQESFVEVLDTPGDIEIAYLVAGMRVVDTCDLLVAVWNGLPAKGKGGTADIVRYALSKHVSIFHINPATMTSDYI